MKIMKKSVSLLLSIVMFLTMFTVLPAAVSAATVNVEYLDANGDTQTVEANYLSSSSTFINPGWYYVPADMTFNSQLELKLSEYDDSTEFNLIIADGETLTFADPTLGIWSEDAVTLNIYSQSHGTGKLKSMSGGDVISLTSEDAVFNLCGGMVTAPDPSDEYDTRSNCFGDMNINGSVMNAVIYAGGALTISGGTVNVPELYSDTDITITGGTVEATDTDVSAITAGGTITLSLTDETSSVRSTGYEGTVQITAYLTDGVNLYNIGTVENNNTLANKTLRHAGHVHNFSAPTWAWDGYTSATATFVCRECGETVTHTAEGDAITAQVVTEPTASSYGRTDYTAILIVIGTAYTDTKSRTTHTGSHLFGDPVWEWDGYEAATLTLTCTVDDEVVTADATVTHETTSEPTYTAAGERVHTATATVDGAEYTDVLYETLPNLDRSVQVSYQNLSKQNKTVTAAKIVGDETTLTSGWYAVTDDVTINSRVYCDGNVNLILCDGAKCSSKNGIGMRDSSSLTIWAQSDGDNMGKLNIDQYGLYTAAIGADSVHYPNSNSFSVTINGGDLDLKGGYDDMVIGCIKGQSLTLTINGGDVYARSSGSSYRPTFGAEDTGNFAFYMTGGKVDVSHTDLYSRYPVIGASTESAKDAVISITGGELYANGPIGCYTSTHASLYFGWKSLDGCKIYSTMYTGKVTLLGGFTDGSTDYPKGEVSDPSVLDGKTLTPYCDHSRHTEPIWTWNTEGEITATAEYNCADCWSDPHSINAPVTAEDHLFERRYSATVTVDGVEYTDRCATTFERSLDILIGGTYITKDNYNDVLGDGTVSYNYDTNTLTLNNANFNIARYGIFSAAGIRYNEKHDKPFHIVLKGENRIGNADCASDNMFIWMESASPCMTISGSGSLSIEFNGDSTYTYMYGIATEVPLTIDGCQIDIYAAGYDLYKYGVWLVGEADGLSIKNNASVSISVYGSHSYAVGSNSARTGAIDIEEGSTFDAYSSNALFYGVRLTESSLASGAAVTNQYINKNYEYHAGLTPTYEYWDGTTPINSYYGVIIPQSMGIYDITVNSAGHGYATCDVIKAKKGTRVAVNASPDDGYRLAYLTVAEDHGSTYNVYDSAFTMAPDAVTVTANFVTYVDRVEPYIDSNGEYIPGTVEHFVLNGKNYAVKSNGCMGDQLADLSFSYFKFDDVDDSDLEIYGYTGPTSDLTKLEIPKTYQGKKITTLYFGNSLGAKMSTPYEVVLTENVTTIKSSAFRYTRIAKVSGDTSGLKEIGNEAFSYNRTSGNNLDIRLDYPGEIKCSSYAFEYTNVTAHLKHATTLSGNHAARSLTYDFTDEHLCDGNITWKWSSGYTAAAATYTCSDSRCRKQATVDAALSGTFQNNGMCTITATVVIDGVTYTDSKTVQSSTLFVAATEPYINEEGAYIPGNVAHYAVGDRYYAANADGSVGSELNDVKISYFDFEGDDTLKITGYTGPVTDGMDLMIPKTYDGKAITMLGNGENKLYDDAGKTVNVYLTENISVINSYCFNTINVLAIAGDTTNLQVIGTEAFADNSEQLNLYLDYPNTILIVSDCFTNTDVVFHMKHSARFLLDLTGTKKVTYDFTDDHIYGGQQTPTWEWEDDYSGATATMTCTDSRCQHKEPFDATITKTAALDKTTYTATAVINGNTYTDVVEVQKTQHTVTVTDLANGSVSADKAQAYEGETVILTVTPDDGYKLQSLTVKDADDNDIPLSGLSFIMTDRNVTVTAVFRQTAFAITYAETSGGWVRGAYSADAGATVTLTVDSASGYELDTLIVTDSSDQEITVTNDSFIMPESDVTVTATFKKYDLNITYSESEHGTVTGASKAKFNDEVPFTVTPDEGYILLNLYAETEEWDDPVNIIDGNLIMADDNVTVYAEFVPYIPMAEPYIDENGAYHLGNIAYADADGSYFEVKDGVVGSSVESVELSYFDFALINNNTEYRINYYTGPTENLSRLEIPKTFNGKPITVLGSTSNKGFYSGRKTQFELVLTENIREIGPYTFYVYYVTKVSGDTSGLNKIDDYAFSWANSPGGYTLDLQLDYPGKITVGAYVFNHMNVTLRLKHATTFSKTNFGAQKVTYQFTDAHIYGEPKWTWEDDYSSATATFTCTDSRCKHQETPDVTVTADYTGDSHLYTATATVDGNTYTDTATEEHTCGEPVWSWSADHSTATLTVTCANADCAHEETVAASVISDTEDGVIIYTATAEYDGTVYTDVQTAYTDGVGAKLAGHSISLDGDIAVNFYMELSDSVIAHKDTAYMHFTIPVGSGTTEQKMLVKDALIKEWNGKDYYVFKCRVAAKEMTSEIKAQIIDGDQNGTEYTYSVKEYADYLIEHADEREDLAAAVPLVKAMLNYGAYAQIYFDKNPGTLANEIMDETEKELGDVTITAPETAFDLPAGVTFGGATLSLKSETTLSLYFKSNTTLTFSCGDYTVETAASGGYQIARIRGIKAKHIGNTFTLIVNGGTVTYSPLNYCKNVLPDSTASPDEAQNQQDEHLQNVVKALYQYWQAADAYFSE